MKQDKAWLELDGVPLIEHVARRLLPLAGEFVFSANDPEPFAGLISRMPAPARVVPDIYPGAGPLAGLHAGLAAANNDHVFAVATDMPFVNPAVVQLMVNSCLDADAALVWVDVEGLLEPQPEPLHAIYRKSCLPAIESALARGQRRVTSFLDNVRVCRVDEGLVRAVDPLLRSFRNLNTPEEWAEAKASWTR